MAEHDEEPRRGRGRIQQDHDIERQQQRAARRLGRTRARPPSASARPTNKNARASAPGRLSIPPSGRVGRDAQGRVTRTTHIDLQPVKVGESAAGAVAYATRADTYTSRDDLETVAGDAATTERAIEAVDAAATVRRGPSREKTAQKLTMELPADVGPDGRAAAAQAVVRQLQRQGYEAVAGVHGRDSVQPHLHVVATARPIGADGTVDRDKSKVLGRGKAELRQLRMELADTVTGAAGTAVRLYGGRDRELAEPGIEGRAPKRRVPMPAWVRGQDERDPAAVQRKREAEHQRRQQAAQRAEERRRRRRQRAAGRAKRDAELIGAEVTDPRKRQRRERTLEQRGRKQGRQEAARGEIPLTKNGRTARDLLDQIEQQRATAQDLRAKLDAEQQKRPAPPSAKQRDNALGVVQRLGLGDDVAQLVREDHRAAGAVIGLDMQRQRAQQPQRGKRPRNQSRGGEGHG